jgi:hypothetical protein
MTAPVMIKLPNQCGVSTVRAWLTLVPGLVIHENRDGSGWVVTHQRSGLGAFACPDPESAHAAAADLGEGVDWTRSVADLLADPIASRRLYEVRCRPDRVSPAVRSAVPTRSRLAGCTKCGAERFRFARQTATGPTSIRWDRDTADPLLTGAPDLVQPAPG